MTYKSDTSGLHDHMTTLNHT